MKIIIISLLSLIVIYIAGGFIGTNIVMKRFFARVDRQGNFSSSLRYEDISQELQRRNFSFYSGNNQLRGAIYTSAFEEVTEEPLLVIVHGFGGDMDSYYSTVQYFVNQGWRVIVYNGTGVESSGGESRVSLTQAVDDLRALLTYLSRDEELGELPVMLLGHSQGGYAVTAVLNHEESSSVRKVVSFAGMNRAGDMIDIFGRNMVGGFYSILKPFVFFNKMTDFREGMTNSAVRGINTAEIPVMLIQGTEDDVVPADTGAITNFWDEITNHEAEAVYLSDYWNGGHMNIFWSQDAYHYREEVNAGLERYRYEQGITVPTDSDLNAWAEAIQLDRARLNAINIDLFSKINTFFLE